MYLCEGIIVPGTLVSKLLSMYLCEGIIVPGTLVSKLLSVYLCEGIIVPGTLVSKLLYHACFNNSSHKLPAFIENGHVDSIRSLLYRAHFIKPYSDEHTLVYLLTKSFLNVLTIYTFICHLII